MISFLLACLIASFVSYILTYPSSYSFLSFQKGNLRNNSIAPAAGPSLLAGTFAGMVVLLATIKNEIDVLFVDWAFIFCSIGFVALGVVDDLFALSAKTKLLGQLVILIPATLITRDLIGAPFGASVESIYYLLELLFLLLIVNAMNLLDGHDGLACSVGLIVLVTLNLGWAAQPHLPILAATISIPGVLIRNYPPAKIYLGDSGSMLIGFWVGRTLLDVLAESHYSVYSLISGFLLLSLPLSDTFAAILRRTLSNRKVFAGDRLHIHHRLQGKYRDRAKTLWVLIGYLALSSVLATISFHLQTSLLSIFGLICLWSLWIWKRHFLWLELVLVKGWGVSFLSNRE